MKEFQISRYIKKWLPLIIASCTVLTVMVYLFLSRSQTYVASAVIRYEGENAEQGLTPIGSPLNVEEIKSSAVMSKVISRLNLDENRYSVDNLISRITIQDVMDEDEKLRKEALLDAGEEYIYKPTTYIVSFEVGSNESAYFARAILDEVLDVYFSTYSEKYVNSNYTINPLKDLNHKNYDYIEMMELIDSNVDSALQAFSKRSENSGSFRAASTGLTFDDLYDEFSYVQSVKISSIFSKIFGNQITKDKPLLLAKYRERINKNNIVQKTEAEKIQDVLELIDAYVNKMRASNNTNITYEYILDEVYDKEHRDSYGEVVGKGDQTVTYDRLIYSWRDHANSGEYAGIDTAYCNYIIDVFSRCMGICKNAAGGTETICQSSDLTCTGFEKEEYEKNVSEIEMGITELISTLNQLYETADQTNAEYNEYIGATYISTLSSVSTRSGLNVMLYTAIAFVFLMLICCCVAILIGRLNDIVQYVFYTDTLTGLQNRNAFDTFLQNTEQRILDDGTVCVSMVITNQPEINQAAGREEGDKLIQIFAQMLREAFAKTGAYLVYNGKAQFIAMIENTDEMSAEQMVQRFRFALDHREILKNTEIEYEIGIAETKRDNIRKMRALLTKAISSQIKYRSAGKE